MAALLGLVLLFGFLGGVRGAYAQSLSADAERRLAPRLRAVATGAPSAQSLGPLLSTSSQGRKYDVFVHAADVSSLAEEEGLPLRPVGTGLATARVTPAQLRTLARTEGVSRVAAARTYTPLNDLVRATTGAHSLQTGTLGRSYTGEDVLACVIDTGIDWSHPDFRAPDDPSQSRIRAIWDQTLSPRSSEHPPEGFNYGVEYTRADVERALGEGGRGVRSVDSSGHGTHVAATIAGTGAAGPSRTHRGMAPEAELIVVKTDFSGVGIADGLRYCRSIAESADRPVVANLSLGTAGGPHDGSSSLAQAIDAFTGPGRSVVVAAGNQGDGRTHLARTLPPGTTDSLAIRVPRYAPSEGPNNDVAFRLDVWRPAVASGSVSVATPSGAQVPLLPDTAGTISTPDGTIAYERATPPRGGQRIELLTYDAGDTPPSPGTWSLVVENASPAPVRLDGWMVNTTTNSVLPAGDRRMTVTAPATARSALTVGAWTHRTQWQSRDGPRVSPGSEQVGAPASFSSRGPLRRDLRKPDLTAPGQWTVSARSGTAASSPDHAISQRYTLRRGTSTSAAAASGAVALLFGADPSLSGRRVKTLLSEHAQSASSSSWTPERGHGRLDVFSSMTALRETAVAARAGSLPGPWGPPDAQTTHRLGEGATRALALRFSPDESGTVDGLFLRTGPAPSTRPRDSVRVTIRTDDDGTPGRVLGRPVQIAPAALSAHTTNFVSLANAGAVVRAGTKYHVVLHVPDGSGELHIAGDRQAVEGRSSVRSNGRWAPLSADLGLSVTVSLALDLGTPRPSAPANRAILDADAPPTLSWETVSGASAYEIQVSPSSRFPPSRTDTLRRSSPSLQLEGLAPGRSYHWRVRAERLGYSGAWSDARSFLYYPPRVRMDVSKSFAPEDTSSAYRLVALPGRQSRSLKRTLKGRTNTDWDAYWERGRGAETLISFDGSSTFRFRPGNGFWLRSERAWRVRDAVRSVPLRDDGTYAIPLHPGWNIISNPFDRALPWSAVRAANEDPLSPLWRFTSQFAEADTFASARSGTAYYYLNDQERETLRLPYPTFPGVSDRTASAPPRPPSLTLGAVRKGTTASRVQIGLHEDAENGRDEYDRVAPPIQFSRTTLRLTTSDEEVPPRRRLLAAEYRSPDTDGHTFPLTLRAEPGVPVTLQASGLDALEGQEIVLVDPGSGESYDLRSSPTVTLRPEEGPRSLQLLVGSSEYVQSKQEAALPSDLRFLPNYPNPFSERTSLEYVLPEPASVRLVVYDILGRQVRVLVDERQKKGRHTVQWDGRDESGSRMASGVYLARLVVDGTTKVRKMTFVR